MNIWTRKSSLCWSWSKPKFELQTIIENDCISFFVTVCLATSISISILVSLFAMGMFWAWSLVYLRFISSLACGLPSQHGSKIIRRDKDDQIIAQYSIAGNCYKYISIQQRNIAKSLKPCNIFCEKTMPGVNGASVSLVLEPFWQHMAQPQYPFST